MSDALKEKLFKADFSNLDRKGVLQGYDDITHEFMQSEFGITDYSDAEVSGEFYQFHACDLRNDAENAGIEAIKQKIITETEWQAEQEENKSHQ